MSHVRHSHRVTFPGHSNLPLAGIVDGPEHPVATALFTHCFTCNKDLKAIVRISRRLAELGIRVLRYDWTGLGQSGGSFVDTNFSTGVADLRCAARYLTANGHPPDFLIGYSLGGVASYAAGAELDTVRGVATIGAPDDTVHLADLLERMNPEIVDRGMGDVEIGGRSWEIRTPLVEDLRNYPFRQKIARWSKPALIIHSLEDETVSYRRALSLAERLRGNSSEDVTSAPVSLVTLTNADHLLSREPRDLEFVSQTLAAWMHRFVA